MLAWFRVSYLNWFSEVSQLQSEPVGILKTPQQESCRLNILVGLPGPLLPSISKTRPPPRCLDLRLHPQYIRRILGKKEKDKKRYQLRIRCVRDREGGFSSSATVARSRHQWIATRQKSQNGRAVVNLRSAAAGAAGRTRLDISCWRRRISARDILHLGEKGVIFYSGNDRRENANQPTTPPSIRTVFSSSSDPFYCHSTTSESSAGFIEHCWVVLGKVKVNEDTLE